MKKVLKGEMGGVENCGDLKGSKLFVGSSREETVYFVL
jgi:hypothetical protein